MALEGPEHAITVKRERTSASRDTTPGPALDSLQPYPQPCSASPPRPETLCPSPPDYRDDLPRNTQPYSAPQPQQKRTVCDNCRRRRVRCDGRFPCDRCLKASLTCKRDHVPRKRGPKPGHGKVIDGIRANDDCPSETVPSDFGPSFPHYPTGLRDGSPGMPWASSAFTTESQGHFSTEQYRPNSRNYLDMIPELVSLYYEHIYPIMPLVYLPTVRSMIQRQLDPPEKRYIYALCALTAFHMSAKNVDPLGVSSPTTGQPKPKGSWESIGRFFLDESISASRSYDFEDDVSLTAIVSSFWTSTSFFELNQTQKSWHYLKEALMLALDLGLDNQAKYAGLSPEENLCRLRVFWILFVTERSFAIFRRKPLILMRTPPLPQGMHQYEQPDIQIGLLKLIFQYYPLNAEFVNAWNEEGNAVVNRETFLHLHTLLEAPPASPLSSPVSSPASPAPKAEPEELEPTEIQRADLLMTQQWLRLVVWQSSLRQGLLTMNAKDPCMSFSFPMMIARDTVAGLMSLPEKAVEVHGMGIMEKIFEIASTSLNVMQTCEKTWGGMETMDLSRRQFLHNPIEFFVSRLSASESSRCMFADKLVMLATQEPAALKMAMSPPLSAAVPPPFQHDHKLLLSSPPSPGSSPLRIKVEPDSEPGSSSATIVNPSSHPSPISTPLGSLSRAADSTPRTRKRDNEEDDGEEIERSSPVCHASRFGYYAF